MSNRVQDGRSPCRLASSACHWTPCPASPPSPPAGRKTARGHERRARLRAGRRRRLRHPAVPAADAEAQGDARRLGRLVVVGGADHAQQCRVDRLLRPLPRLERPCPLLLGDGARRRAHRHARRLAPGAAAFPGPDGRVGGRAGRRGERQRSRGPRYAAHRGVRHAGRAVTAGRVPDSAPKRHRGRNLDAHPRRTRLLPGLRPAPARPEADHPRVDRGHREHAHAHPRPVDRAAPPPGVSCRAWSDSSPAENGRLLMV